MLNRWAPPQARQQARFRRKCKLATMALTLAALLPSLATAQYESVCSSTFEKDNTYGCTDAGVDWVTSGPITCQNSSLNSAPQHSCRNQSQQRFQASINSDAGPIKTLVIVSDWRDAQENGDDYDGTLEIRLNGSGTSVDYRSLGKAQNTEIIDLSDNKETYDHIQLQFTCGYSYNAGQKVECGSVTVSGITLSLCHPATHMHVDEDGTTVLGYYNPNNSNDNSVYTDTGLTSTVTLPKIYQCRQKQNVSVYCYTHRLLPTGLTGATNDSTNAFLPAGQFTTNCYDNNIGVGQYDHQTCMSAIPAYQAGVVATRYWQAASTADALRNVVSLNIIPGCYYDHSHWYDILSVQTAPQIQVHVGYQLKNADTQSYSPVSLVDINSAFLSYVKSSTLDDDAEDGGAAAITTILSFAIDGTAGGPDKFAQSIYQIDIRLQNSRNTNGYIAGYFLLQLTEEALATECATATLVFTAPTDPFTFTAGLSTDLAGQADLSTFEVWPLISTTGSAASCEEFYRFELTNYDDTKFESATIDENTGVISAQLKDGVKEQAESAEGTHFKITVTLKNSAGEDINSTEAQSVVGSVHYLIDQCNFTFGTWPSKEIQTRQNQIDIAIPAVTVKEICNTLVSQKIEVLSSEDSSVLLTMDGSTDEASNGIIPGLTLSQWKATVNLLDKKADLTGHTTYVLKYTLKRENRLSDGSTTKTLSSAEHSIEMTVTYIDRCDDPADSGFDPFAISNMLTSVLRPESESEAGDLPDLEQELAGTATITLEAPESSYTNNDMCGPIKLVLTDDVDKTETWGVPSFITLDHAYCDPDIGTYCATKVDGDAFTNKIIVNPTLNDHVSATNVVARLYFSDYSTSGNGQDANVKLDIPFTVTVTHCEILKILNTDYSGDNVAAVDDNGVRREMDFSAAEDFYDASLNYLILHNVQGEENYDPRTDGQKHNFMFQLLKDTKQTFTMTKYKYYPTCDFEATYSFLEQPERLEDLEGRVDKESDHTIFWEESTYVYEALSDSAQAADDKAVSPPFEISFKSDDPLDGGGYIFKVNVVVDTQGASYDPAKGVIQEFSRQIYVYADNPCLSTVLETSLPRIGGVPQLNLYTILGVESAISFGEYSDTNSRERDAFGENNGFETCGERAHEFREYPEDSDGNIDLSSELYKSGRQLPFLRLNDYGSTLILSYDTKLSYLAGKHVIVFYVYLADYFNFLSSYDGLKNDEGRINVTFFKLQTDLTIEDAEYTLSTGAYEIEIPKPEFYPQLHESENEETGANGAELFCQVFTKEKSTEYTLIDPKLGSFDQDRIILTINAHDTKFMLIKSVMIRFTGQDYIDGQVLETEFFIQINPQPAEDQYGPKPFFVLNGYKPFYDIYVGQSWQFELPLGMHPNEDFIVSYRKVEIGNAGTFLTHDKANDMLIIERDATTSSSVGSYKIQLQLQDSSGKFSEVHTVVINILEQETEGDDDETAVGDVTLINQSGYYGSQLWGKERNKDSFLDIGSANIGIPTAKLQRVTAGGQVTISFSNQMFVEEELKTLNQDGVLVKTGFLRQLKERDDGTSPQNVTTVQSTSGAKQQRVKRDVLEIKIIPGGYTDEKDLGFKWAVTQFTSKQLKIQLEFEKPRLISATPEPEEIEIYLKSEETFYDLYGQSLSADTKLTRILPPQVGDAAALEALKDTSGAIGTGTQTAVVINFIINLTLSASLQYLWEMINAQQIVILLPLFHVTFPSNAAVIFDGLMMVASFELIPTDIIYEYFFDSNELEEDEVNQKFASIGFEHHLLYNNFGTLGFVLLCLPLLYLLYFMIVKCRGIRCLRKTTNYLRPMLFWNTILRLIIESYIIGLVCCLINIKVIQLSTDLDRWTFANGILTLIFLPIFVLFPIIAEIYMYRNWEKLEEKSVKGKYGEVYEGYNTKEKHMLIYWGIDYARKILITLVVVMQQDQFWLQSFLLIMSSVFLIIANGHINVRKTSYDQRMDCFNEIKLIVLMYHMMLFTMFVPDVEMQFQIGYSCAAFLVCSTAANMFLLFAAPISLCRRRLRIRYHKKRAQKDLRRIKKMKIAKGTRERCKQKYEERLARQKEFLATLHEVRANHLRLEMERQRMVYEELHRKHQENRQRRHERKFFGYMDSSDDSSDGQLPSPTFQQQEPEQVNNSELIEEKKDVQESRVNAKRKFIIDEHADHPYMDSNKPSGGGLHMIDTTQPAAGADNQVTHLHSYTIQTEQSMMNEDRGALRINTGEPNAAFDYSHEEEEWEEPLPFEAAQRKAAIFSNNYDENCMRESPLKAPLPPQPASQLTNAQKQTLMNANRNKNFGFPAKLSFQDLEDLWVHHNLSIQDIESMPGFENFEVTGNSEKFAHLIDQDEVDAIFEQAQLLKQQESMQQQQQAPLAAYSGFVAQQEPYLQSLPLRNATVVRSEHHEAPYHQHLQGNYGAMLGNNVKRSAVMPLNVSDADLDNMLREEHSQFGHHFC